MLINSYPKTDLITYSNLSVLELEVNSAFLFKTNAEFKYKKKINLSGIEVNL